MLNNFSYYSRLPVTRTLCNSNLPLTRSNFHFPKNIFYTNFTLDNSNFILFPLKDRVIGSRLYLATDSCTLPYQKIKNKQIGNTI